MTQAENYPIAIRRTNDGYIAEVTAVGLTQTGADLTALEANVRATVNEILAACKRHDVNIEPTQARDVTASRHNPYRRTITSAMVVVLLIVVISMPMLWGFQRIASYMSSSMEQLGTADMGKFFSANVHKVADTLEMITPNRREDLTRDFGRIARALEPYAAELRPLLSIPVSPGSPAPPTSEARPAPQGNGRP